MAPKTSPSRPVKRGKRQLAARRKWRRAGRSLAAAVSRAAGGVLAAGTGAARLSARFSRTCSRVWQDNPFLRRWARKVGVGAAIESLVVVAAGTAILVSAQNLALDWVMRIAAAPTQMRAPPEAPLGYLDVDEETWRSERWGGGEPTTAPRDQLYALIEAAVDRGARYVVVDIIIDGRPTLEDELFAAKVDELAARIKGRRQARQHLLFVRTLRRPFPDDGGLAPILRPSVLDTVIARHPETLHSVAPYFEISRDGIIRDWRLWRPVCTPLGQPGKGQWAATPSVQLLISTLEASRRDGATISFPHRFAERCEHSFEPALVNSSVARDRVIDKAAWSWLQQHPSVTADREVGELHVGAFTLSSKIFYRFAEGDQAVKRLSAGYVLGHPERIAKDAFQGGVVVIGQSFEAARDVHATPLGAMSGPLVILNSIDSLARTGVLRPPPEWFENLFRLVSIVGFGAICAWAVTARQALIVNLGFVVALFALNAFFLRVGYWLDFSLPLVGMLLDYWSEQIGHLFKSQGKESEHA